MILIFIYIYVYIFVSLSEGLLSHLRKSFSTDRFGRETAELSSCNTSNGNAVKPVASSSNHWLIYSQSQSRAPDRTACPRVLPGQWALVGVRVCLILSVY